jgi:hypothetical protein
MSRIAITFQETEARELLDFLIWAQRHGYKIRRLERMPGRKYRKSTPLLGALRKLKRELGPAAAAKRSR